MELPKRIDTHITETASYKIFSSKIPNQWIIRDVNERDYGIDCYIELVDDKNQVTGQLISIQLKGRQEIDWTREDYFTLSGINKETSNYWYIFPLPVFICLVDIGTKEAFFLPVKSYIRENFLEFQKDSFSYRVKKQNNLELTCIKNFLTSFFNEKKIYDFENNLKLFVSHIDEYKEFISTNQYRDYHLGVEMDRVFYLENFYKNLYFLANYFGLNWSLEPLNHYFIENRKNFGNDYLLHEHYLHIIVTGLEKEILPILLRLKEVITEKEKQYWISINIHLFNYMINVRKDGSLPHLL